MRICVLQMSPSPDKSANIAQAQTLVDRAIADTGRASSASPRFGHVFGGSVKTRVDNGESLPDPVSGEEGGGPAYNFLRNIARGNGIYVRVQGCAGCPICKSSLGYPREIPGIRGQNAPPAGPGLTSPWQRQAMSRHEGRSSIQRAGTTSAGQYGLSASAK